MAEYIYCMTNDDLRRNGCVKIGRTTDIDQRRKSLSSSGLLHDFNIIGYWSSANSRYDERLIFSYLENYRLRSNREIFAGNILHILNTCREVILQTKYNIEPSPEKLFDDDFIDSLTLRNY